MSEYVNYYTGKTLIEKATDIVLMKKFFRGDDLSKLTQLRNAVEQVYHNNEGFDGEPTSAEWLAQEAIKFWETVRTK